MRTIAASNHCASTYKGQSRRAQQGEESGAHHDASGSRECRLRRRRASVPTCAGSECAHNQRQLTALGLIGPSTGSCQAATAAVRGVTLAGDVRGCATPQGLCTCVCESQAPSRTAARLIGAHAQHEDQTRVSAWGVRRRRLSSPRRARRRRVLIRSQEWHDHDEVKTYLAIYEREKCIKDGACRCDAKQTHAPYLR